MVQTMSVVLRTLRIATLPSPAKLYPISCTKFCILGKSMLISLRFYQVIMTIDIFQYSNMYTLVSSFQRLADEAHVRDECGPYVTRPGLLFFFTFFIYLFLF